MYHNKGMKKELNALAPRYKFVGDMVDHYKPKTIIETGTNTGARALMMIQHALKHTDAVHYTGYDLFEDTTPELNLKEFNNKPMFSLKDGAYGLKGRGSVLKAFKDSALMIKDIAVTQGRWGEFIIPPLAEDGVPYLKDNQ